MKRVRAGGLLLTLLATALATTVAVAADHTFREMGAVLDGKLSS